jgi:hypothetical protein
MVAFNFNLYKRLSYPPQSDQLMYLAGGEMFGEQLRFFWRAPLYGFWMGLFYLGAGRDQRLAFYAEKYVSMFLLGVAIAYLGKALFDTRTGVLMGVWALNCKYLVLETNSSHIIAAVLYTVSLLCFFLPERKARLPFALFALLLSTQVRSEMWVSLFVVAICLCAYAILIRLKGKSLQPVLEIGSVKYWKMAALAASAVLLIFNLRIGPPEDHRLSEAFAMNFALNYLERNRPLQLDNQDWKNVWVTALPGVSPSFEAIEKNRGEIHPFAAILNYPQEMVSHVVYNLKLFLYAFPATVLAFDRQLVVAIAFLIYTLSYILRKPDWNALRHRISPHDRMWIVIWSFSIVSLIPVSFALRVVARYYIPLIPILMAAVMICAHLVLFRCLSGAKLTRGID